MPDPALSWFKSSFSAQNGGCVEVAFQKSSFSAQNGGCVEVARPGADRVLVRDTKDRSKPPHEYTDREWAAFVQGVKAGEFDLP
jgi:Domain of unknown function (DUF397)